MNITSTSHQPVVRLHVRALWPRWPAFRFFGVLGFVVAMFLAMGLTMARSLSVPAMALIVATAVAMFFGLAMFTKILSGQESLTYYHHQVVVLGFSALLLRVAGQPVFPYLDVAILGVGLFTAFGRIGCLMVGCCHGRPSAWGVRYRDEHAAAGFTACLVGVPLFPVQAVESLWLLAIVGTGAAMVMTGHPPGDALTWYVIAYGAGRFTLEFLRGDAVRPYLWGFSEAQWTSLVLMAFVVVGEAAGLVSFHWWHTLATGGVALGMFAVAVRRRFERPPIHRLLHPRHVQEVAEALAMLSDRATRHANRMRSMLAATEIGVARTSLGIRLSGGEVTRVGVTARHYALSSTGADMDEATARVLGDLIVRLGRLSAGYELIQGKHGVFHLVGHLTSGGQPARREALSREALSRVH